MKRLILNKDGSYFYLWKYIHALGGFNFVITDTSNLPVSISEDKILESHDFLDEYFTNNSLALPYLNNDKWGYNPILLKFSLNKDLIELEEVRICSVNYNKEKDEYFSLLENSNGNALEFEKLYIGSTPSELFISDSKTIDIKSGISLLDYKSEYSRWINEYQDKNYKLDYDKIYIGKDCLLTLEQNTKEINDIISGDSKDHIDDDKIGDMLRCHDLSFAWHIGKYKVEYVKSKDVETNEIGNYAIIIRAENNNKEIKYVSES